MTDHDRPLPVARVVVARHILASGECAAVRLRAGEDVVLVRLVADAIHELALLADRGQLIDPVAEARLLERIAVQFGGVSRNLLAARVEPGACADAIARVDGVRTLRAQIRAPDAIARAGLPGRGRELLAMRVGSLKTAEVCTVANRRAGDEKSHRRFRAGLLLCRQDGSGDDGCCRSNYKDTSLHLDLLVSRGAVCAPNLKSMLLA